MQQAAPFPHPSSYYSQEEELILHHLRKAEHEASFYRKRYLESKSINASIIAAIKRVYSQEVGDELQKIVEEQQRGFSASREDVNEADMTDNFCQKLKTYGSKLVSEQSVERLPLRLVTPNKNESSYGGSAIKEARKLNLSPLLGKSAAKNRELSSSTLKGECYEPSTRRSYTPVKYNIATEIFCELCEKVFPPNEFVSHAEKCKYELEYIDSASQALSIGRQSKVIQVSYDKMMRSLLKIRQEIEQQIYMISASKEQIDRANLKKKLEKDLKKVLKVIKQKQQELLKKKGSSVKISSVRPGLSRKTSKLR